MKNHKSFFILLQNKNLLLDLILIFGARDGVRTHEKPAVYGTAALPTELPGQETMPD